MDKRAKADHTFRYRCSVSIKKDGRRNYSESKSFTKQAHAKTWRSKRVIELEQSRIPNRNDLNKLTVEDPLKRYISAPNLDGTAGRTIDMPSICYRTATSSTPPYRPLIQPRSSIAAAVEERRRRWLFYC